MVLAGLPLLASLVTSIALAQSVPTIAPMIGKSHGAPRPLGAVTPQQTAPPAIPAPSIPQQAAPSSLSEGPHFLLRGISVRGSTILTRKEVDQIAAPYLNRRIGTNELEEIRRLLTVAYIEKGYVNSGAVLPDQHVANGIIVYQIIEGRLADVAVTGTRHFSPGYFRRRLARAATPPLDINKLNREVRVLLQDPAIKQLNVDLRPGLKPGDALLRADVVENKPWDLSFTIANDTPPSIGPIHGQVAGTYRNLLGLGDTISGSYGRTDGLNDGSAAISVPVTAADTTLLAHYDRNDSIVIDDIFRTLDITSETETIGAGIDQPLYRTGDESLGVGFMLDYRSSRTFLLGQPFDLSPGSVDGRTKAFVLRLNQNWLRRTAVDAIALRSTFSLGIATLGATNAAAPPNANFRTWLGQLQYVRQIFKTQQLVFRADIQLANAPLFSFEQIAIGGAGTVRGYRENTLVRDNAVILSLEDHIPVVHRRVLGVDSTLEVVPFGDYGKGRNSRGVTPEPRDIASLGIGLHAALGSRVQAKLDWGHGFTTIRYANEDLQDSGVHFQVTTLF